MYSYTNVILVFIIIVIECNSNITLYSASNIFIYNDLPVKLLVTFNI